jgi:putative selenate reductase molybdopterin-binding subunit
MSISFTLNGSPRTVIAEPGESLQVLLQRMGIHSVRASDDGEGFAGSDTILFDGKPVLAGLMIAAQSEGHSIETVEGLMENHALSALQAAMLDAGVVQSGYNAPAAVLLLEDLRRRNAEPTKEDVRDALSGLFSRATGYIQFFHAVRLAREKRPSGPVPGGAEREAGVAPTNGGRVIGAPHRRVDGVKLVSGMKAFVEDRVEPGSCVLAMLRSPHAHAYIKEMDTAEAEKFPGIVAVITWKNCPDVYYTTAGQGFPEPSPYDYRMFNRKVRHVGDRVAAVVAETGAAAYQALKLIKVEYEVLKPVLSLEDAMNVRGGRAVHGGDAVLASGEPAARASREADSREGKIVYQFPIGAEPARNLAASASGAIGDVERGLKEADVVIERSYTTSKVQCTPLEPHVVYTRMDGDRLIIHASTQVPWHLRRIVATILGIPENRVRVIKERVGGGYGSKQDVLLEDVCAYATFITGRSVFSKYTREEEFIAATTRHPFHFTVTMGARRDGTLTAVRLTADTDTGAYGNHCLTVPMNACSKSLPLFPCANTAFELRSWYTNHVPSGAYQGYGAPQGSFAVQTAAAELAAELGMDFLDFIKKNGVREGDVLEILKSLGEGREGSAVRVQSCGLERALAEGREMIGWDRREASPHPDVKIGKGVVIIQQGSGLPGLDQAGADVKLLSDGSLLVRSGGADLGTGLDTVVTKIVCQTLCVDMDRVALISGDTDTTPFDKGAYASSGTFFSGNAALGAARNLAGRILDIAAALLKIPRDRLSLEYPGKVVGEGRAVGFAEIARYCHGGDGPGELVGSATFTSGESAIPYAAHFCRLAVNTRTGAVEILRYCALHDSGTIINPELALGQVYGGILKSIGHALYEEMLFDGEGRCLTADLGSYCAPMIQELPRDIQVRFIETEDPHGPFGGKSVSEISVNGAAPMIAIAIHDAVGVWMREWPFTPEKILSALGRL